MGVGGFGPALLRLLLSLLLHLLSADQEQSSPSEAAFTLLQQHTTLQDLTEGLFGAFIFISRFRGGDDEDDEEEGDNQHTLVVLSAALLPALLG